MVNHAFQTKGDILVDLHQNLVLILHTTTTTQCVLECLNEDNYTQAGDGQNPRFLWTKSEKKKYEVPENGFKKSIIYVFLMKVHI